MLLIQEKLKEKVASVLYREHVYTDLYNLFVGKCTAY